MANLNVAKNIAVPSTARASAVSVDGQQSVSTVQVKNNIVGDTELIFGFDNTSSDDKPDLLMFGAAMQVNTTLPEGVTFDGDGFKSYAQFLEYFKHIQTNVKRISIQTDDTDNFLSSLVFEEKFPDSRASIPQKVSLKKYRTPVGSGFSETIEFEKPFLIWAGLSVFFSKIKAGSQVTFTLTVEGVNNVSTLSAI